MKLLPVLVALLFSTSVEAATTLYSNESNGRVGIGTANPQNQLDSYNDANFVAARAASSAGITFVGAQANDYWSTPTFMGTYVAQYGSSYPGSLYGLPVASLGKLVFQNGSAALIEANVSDLYFCAFCGTVPQMVLKSNGNVGIGTITPSSVLTVVQAGSTQAYFGSTGNAGSVVAIDNAAGGKSSNLYWQDAGVTKWSANTGGSSEWYLRDTVNSKTFIFAVPAGNLVIGPNQTTISDQSGNLALNSTGAFGYTTGAGGTVTQATSKSTGVTLNKVSGEITMNSAALAAGVIVSFILTDSTINAGDLLQLQHQSGGTLGAYTLNASCASGNATIYVRNNTAASLSEPIVIRYNLIRGAQN